MGVEASVIVELGDGVSSDAIVKVELDELHENNLDSDGELKSSFAITDSPVFLIHHEESVTVSAVKSTDGNVSKIGTNQSRTRSVTDSLFVDIQSSVELSYANITSVSDTWKGNTAEIGDIIDSVIKLSSGEFPCVGDLEYSVLFNERWMLTPPLMSLGEEGEYKIVVVVYVEAK